MRLVTERLNHSVPRFLRTWVADNILLTIHAADIRAGGVNPAVTSLLVIVLACTGWEYPPVSFKLLITYPVGMDVRAACAAAGAGELHQGRSGR